MKRKRTDCLWFPRDIFQIIESYAYECSGRLISKTFCSHSELNRFCVPNNPTTYHLNNSFRCECHQESVTLKSGRTVFQHFESWALTQVIHEQGQTFIIGMDKIYKWNSQKQRFGIFIRVPGVVNDAHMQPNGHLVLWVAVKKWHPRNNWVQRIYI